MATGERDAHSSVSEAAATLLWSMRAIVLTVFDATATGAWLHFDIAVEANPFLGRMIESAGVVPAMVMRTVIGVWLVLVLAALVPRSRFALRALAAVTVVLAAVAGWHVVGAGLRLV